MYVISIAVLIAMALIAVAWTPLFALFIAVPLFLGFLAYVGLRPRADETVRAPVTEHNPRTVEDDTPKGIWGEPRP